MPAEVEIVADELRVRLIPRSCNDARILDFECFLEENNLEIITDYGWNARGYHELSVSADSWEEAEEAKEKIEEWGSENL